MARRIALSRAFVTEVAELVDTLQAPGIYQVTFDASNLPGGTYLYQLNTAGSSLSKKMLLIK